MHKCFAFCESYCSLRVLKMLNIYLIRLLRILGITFLPFNTQIIDIKLLANTADARASTRKSRETSSNALAQ